jgi:hypothetical protein
MQKFMKILKWVAIGFVSLLVLTIILAMFAGDTETVTLEAVEQPSLGTYTIDGDDSLFDGYSDAGVEIWASSELNTLSDDINDRTLVTKLARGTEVELLQRDGNDYYCEVRHSNNKGWLACEWLQ